MTFELIGVGILDAFSLLLGVIFLALVVSTIIGVPCMPTHRRQAKKMAEIAGLKPGMVTVDLGSGNGRILFNAAKYGARAIGYELNPMLVAWTKLMVRMRGLKGTVEVKMRSIYDADVKDVDVVFAFLMPKPMEKLEPKLFKELKPGALIISYTFSFPNHQPIKKEQGIFVYKV